MAAGKCQQFLGVGFDLRDFAMQSRTLYGTGAQQATGIVMDVLLASPIEQPHSTDLTP